jgi:hypothetical protein
MKGLQMPSGRLPIAVDLQQERLALQNEGDCSNGGQALEAADVDDERTFVFDPILWCDIPVVDMGPRRVDRTRVYNCCEEPPRLPFIPIQGVSSDDQLVRSSVRKSFRLLQIGSSIGGSRRARGGADNFSKNSHS